MFLIIQSKSFYGAAKDPALRTTGKLGARCAVRGNDPHYPITLYWRNLSLHSAGEDGCKTFHDLEMKPS